MNSQVAVYTSVYSPGFPVGTVLYCLPPREAAAVKGIIFSFIYVLVSNVTFRAASYRSTSVLLAVAQKKINRACTEFSPYLTIPHFMYLVERCFVSTVSDFMFQKINRLTSPVC